MLIDDLLEKEDVKWIKGRLRDAIVFRIHEGINEYAEAHHKFDILPLPSLLPYNNMAVNFNDCIDWYLTEELSQNKMRIWISSIDISDIKTESDEEGVLYVIQEAYIFDKKTLCLIGEQSFNIDTGECSAITPLDANKFKAELSALNLGDAIYQYNSYQYLQSFLRILSCKNIKTELETPDAKIQKKRAAKGKLPLVSFYTLKIQNLSHDTESTNKGLWSNRVHFCRGHMREYTADAPLFGRITGRFWIAPHVRGDKKKGMIIKDYEVNTYKKQEDSK